MEYEDEWDNCNYHNVENDNGGDASGDVFVQEIKHLRAVVRSKEEALAEASRQLEAEQAQVMDLETQLLAQVHNMARVYLY